MWRGIFALLFRSLRTDSRSIRIHLLWLFLLAVIYIALTSAQTTSMFFGAPGLTFFRYVIMINACVLTLLGPSFFSSAISEEKEEDTLGLMMMAGISPLGLLLGKSTSRLFQILILLALQYPFTLLATTLGGLMPIQITAAYISIGAYSILLANMGLMLSVYCRRTRDAAAMTVLWLVAYHILPPLAYGTSMYLVQTKGWSPSQPLHGEILSILGFISRSNVFQSLTEVTQTGFSFRWNEQIIGNSLAGVACFLLAWWLFGFVAMDPAPETSSRGMVAKRNSRFRMFSAGRAWDMSLIWKDFHFVTGGRAGFTLRCLLYGGLYVLCIVANSPATWGSMTYSGWSFRWEDVTHAFLAFAHPLLALDLALCASRVFQEEIKNQTLSSLLMLPRAIPDVVYSKLTGCAIGMIPGVASVLGALFFLPGGSKLIGELFDESAFWWWILSLIALVHLTMLFSLSLRWGALAMAIGVMLGFNFVFVMFVAFFGTFGFARGMNSDATLVLMNLLLIGVCFACHTLILFRLPKLGER